ncbi:MAG TPA: kynureninase [Pyrinomonadaceae bacterium]|nr:kynureninase [Pyrinomonadaceae bacterium]
MSETNIESEAECAASLDEADSLKHFRERFLIPKAADGRDAIYFTGNSLGLQPKTTREYIEAELDDWARLGVEGHLHAAHPWLPYHEFLTEKMARVVGALPIETVVMNSLTVNLHLMLVSFYRPEGKRRKIIIEKGAFPSDRYAVESQLKFHSVADGLIELAPREGEATLRTDDILDAIERVGDELAVVMLGGVNYYTGQAFDMEAITNAGHRAGVIVGFDLAHAAGNLELKLHDWDVDFAVWCSYKYLNAGPGGIAGAFVHERHARDFDRERFAGWWGHNKETRFLMGPDFVPLEGAEGWQISNPPIFQMAALRASLDIFDEATMSALRTKSVKLTAHLERLLRKIGSDRIEIITPSDPQQRGCQLSIRVKDAKGDLFDAITARGVIADWREPDVIRVAPVPLYNTFKDAEDFAKILRECL